MSPAELMIRIALNSGGITVQKFAEFLKQKVDKKTELQHLLKLTERIDVDNDGKVCETDIITCIKNLPNSAFWKSDSNKSKARTVTNF